MPISAEKYEFAKDNILTMEDAVKKIEELKKENKKIGLCHGGFDMLHPGHVRHFISAKKFCDVLFVSITSDFFVTMRKGGGRPVFPDYLRAYMAANISSVDFVIISDYKSAVEVLNIIKPSFYIKGPDFISKTTPGINAERAAIRNTGGDILYTEDIKLSSTDIIRYIKENIDKKKILICLDRDGTLIEDRDYLGKNDVWAEDIILKNNVVNALFYLQTKYLTTKLVISNQSGVAKKYFDCRRVEEINRFIGNLLTDKGIKIDSWQYCPDIDKKYAEKNRDKFELDKNFVKEKTVRKPGTDMIFNGLNEIKRDIKEFDIIIVFGDKNDDSALAKNIGGVFIDSKLQYEKMIEIIDGIFS